MSDTSSDSKPLIELNLPDPGPLKAAFAALDDHAATLKRLADEKVTLEKTIAEFVDGEHAADHLAENYGKVAGYRMRVEVIPKIITRTIELRYGLADTVLAELKTFEEALAAEGSREREAMLDSIEAEISHRAPGRFMRVHNAPGKEGLIPVYKESRHARRIAAEFPELRSIPYHVNQLNAPQLITRPNPLTWGDGDEAREHNFSRTITSARARADALIAMRDRVAAAGRFGDTLDKIADCHEEEFSASQALRYADLSERKAAETARHADGQASEEQAARHLRDMRAGLTEPQRETLDSMRAAGIAVD